MRVTLTRLRYRAQRVYCWLVHSWTCWYLVRPPDGSVYTVYYRCATCDATAPGWYTR